MRLDVLSRQPGAARRRAMAWVAVAAAGVLSTGFAQAVDLTGSGSTFVFPILWKWAADYHDKTGAKVNYQSIGSGGGITQIKAGRVTFGASDKPLATAELRGAGLVQFPLVIGGIVPVVHLDAVKPGQMRFTGSLLADIYLGKVTQWNDPEIAALNPDVALPADKIVVVHRLDPSGTTFNFTNFLSKSSEAWKGKAGDDTLVPWPVGVGGTGSEGVANYVNYMPGAIGYVELSYAVRHKMKYALVRNRSGAWVEPSPAAFQAAAASTAWEGDDFYAVITDAAGEDAWPIAATTFVLMQQAPADAAASKEALDFFKWSLESGQADARKLDYVPLPDPLVEKIEAYWSSHLRPSGP